jgi:15-cis-phytoene synthase
VREPLAGEIRLQWWRDVIGREGGQGSPVAEALAGAIAAHDLPVQPLLDLLEARIFDLYDDPMPSRNDLEGYCGETASAIFQLAAMILDPDAAPGMADSVGPCRLRHGHRRAGALAARQLARGQCFVPLEWWAMRDSNSRHLRCKRSALPTELIALFSNRLREAAVRGKGKTHWPDR